MAILPILATIAGGAISAIGSRKAAKTQSNAANKAANVQLKATRETNDMLRDFRGQDIQRFAPYEEAGRRALGQYENALADPFRFRPFQSRDFQFNMEMDPGYQFRMQEGRKAVESSAASRHGLGSGAAMKALNRYGQNFASNEFANAFNRQYGMFNDKFNRDYGMYSDDFNRQYGMFNDRLNRLGQLASSGQAAAGMQASTSQNVAGQLGQNTMMAGQTAAQGLANAANAGAAGTVGMTNAFTGGINNALGAWQFNRAMNAFGNNATPQTGGANPSFWSGQY